MFAARRTDDPDFVHFELDLCVLDILAINKVHD